MKNIKQEFTNFLIKKGYREYTVNHTPSTVYDYLGRIEKVCIAESMSFMELMTRIDEILPLYLDNGIKANEGKRSHESVKNALKNFSAFVHEKRLLQKVAS